MTQTSQSINLTAATSGSTVGLPASTGSLAAYNVNNGQEQVVGAFNLNFDKNGLTCEVFVGGFRQYLGYPLGECSGPKLSCPGR